MSSSYCLAKPSSITQNPLSSIFENVQFFFGICRGICLRSSNLRFFYRWWELSGFLSAISQMCDLPLQKRVGTFRLRSPNVRSPNVRSPHAENGGKFQDFRLRSPNMRFSQCRKWWELSGFLSAISRSAISYNADCFKWAPRSIVALQYRT